ncbi:hypothetical protein MKW94_007822 [Papaver nudicaule]|uniref:Uncharacterized protein n=1 Tax=Papaver nudicaule TaxID=74823 RepID=A0AA41VGS8_PAPNU|nr:hypothetical protein [Papaver nudicaule]
MANKIHIFKKSAIEAGTPELYYLNPSENLMKMASGWSVVEHEDFLSLTIHVEAFGQCISISPKGKFIGIQVQTENMENVASDKNGSFEMNPNFLNLRVMGTDPTLRLSEGTFRLFLFKLKAEVMMAAAAAAAV